jgi:DNA-binding response OmpR family regulator
MKKNILIVEDDGSIATSLRLCLKDYGFNVFKNVSTGEEAIESAAENKPDIILMDIKLKGPMSGPQTVIQIRRHSNVPVIFMTGSDQYGLDERLKDTQPYDCIIKPFDVDVLVDKINKFICI